MNNAAHNPSTHLPVMLEEVLDFLRPQKGSLLVDCTLGLAGHSRALLERIGPDGCCLVIDKDKASLESAKENLGDKASRCVFVHDDFRHLKKILKNHGMDKADGILMDLGISSYQLEDQERGFSFRSSGPLDMRMNRKQKISAYDLVNTLTEKELVLILKDYGEERYAKKIARAIVTERKKEPVKTAKQLSSIISEAVPGSAARQKIHPATRSFQALRIAVNHELDSLKGALPAAVASLKPGGRLAVISFHSLEDRIVKNFFKEKSKEGSLDVLTKKPIRPGEDEISKNSRARSAKLRVAERTVHDL